MNLRFSAEVPVTQQITKMTYHDNYIIFITLLAGFNIVDRHSGLQHIFLYPSTESLFYFNRLTRI